MNAPLDLSTSPFLSFVFDEELSLLDIVPIGCAPEFNLVRSFGTECGVVVTGLTCVRACLVRQRLMNC